MLRLQSETLGLSMCDDGTGVAVEDPVRGVRWILDEGTRWVGQVSGRMNFSDFAAAGVDGPESAVKRLGSGRAYRMGEDAIACDYRTALGRVVFCWTLAADRLRVSVEAQPEEPLNAVSLPGTFRPEGAVAFRSAVPVGQGVLHTGHGPAFYRPLWAHGHQSGCNLDMFGQLTDRGGLVVIAETAADASCHWEKTPDGSIRLLWLQHPTFGRLAYRRETVIAPSAPDVTSLCRIYRSYEIENGRFKTWDEKIAERPNVAKLFGSAMVFLGYVQDDQTPYGESLRRLKSLGIDRAYVYPVYLNDAMGTNDAGYRRLDIRALLPVLRELGYAAGGFVYFLDGPMAPDDPTHRDLELDAAGAPRLKWQMGELKWYAFSWAKRSEWAQRFFEEHRGLDAIHCDCLTNEPLDEDYHPDHRGDARADQADREALLNHAGARGLIVSSEGFWGRLTPYYDLGNSKYAHVLGGEEYCVVPMTMLVYHDSAYHTWWEVDNYNNYEHRSQYGRGQTHRFPWGGGCARLQAAIDALMGTPPDIFPFGAQYNFIPHAFPRFYTYRMSLDDPAVRQAIEWAKPVMALNARIGKLPMIEHRLHRPDGAVQETVFADGTRVVANFANAALEVPGLGVLPPESWRQIHD